MPTGGRGISQQGTILQSGTGAVLETIETKERQIVSVMDFGAKGDGSNDDTGAFNTAITALIAVGGGRLYVPAGTYHITGAVNASGLGSNILLEGVGTASNIALDTASAYFRLGQWYVRGLRFSSSQTTFNPFASLYAQSVNDVLIEDVQFVGGGPHILLDTVSGFRVRNTRHLTLTAPYHILFIYNSDHGEIIGARIDSFTYPASASAFRGIEVQNSSYIQVTDPIINSVDATTISNFAGISFAGSHNCGLSGGMISGIKGGDGVATEELASDIVIVGTTSTGNGPGAGAGSNGGVGDGFDIFNSARVRISGCNARNNGNWSANRHPGIEIFTSQDVTVENCDSSDNGLHGVAIVGSQRTKLVSVNAQRNAYAGLNVQAAASVVNTAGTAVTWVSGQVFGNYAANTTITINTVAYLISSVTDTKHLVLTTSAGTQTSVAASVEATDTQVIGGDYSENAVANTGVAGQMEGMYWANGSTAQITVAHATDTRSPKLQTYGIRLENTARATMIGNRLSGNLTNNFLDSVGLSTLVYDDTGGGNVVLNAKAGNAVILQSAGNPFATLGPSVAALAATTIGAGSTISKVIYAQAGLTLGTIPAATNSTFAFAVSGASTTSAVFVSPATGMISPLIASAYVSSAGNVTVVITNGSAAGVAGGTVTFNLWIIQ